MKMLCFRFQQNRTINKHFDFFEGRRGERGLEGRETSFLNFNQNYYWYKYKTVVSYFSKIAILTKNLTFLSEGGGKRTPYLNFDLNYYW